MVATQQISSTREVGLFQTHQSIDKTNRLHLLFMNMCSDHSTPRATFNSELYELSHNTLKMFRESQLSWNSLGQQSSGLQK